MGAVAIHSHMADLPRILFLGLSSFVLPLQFLRYFYFFITLALGPVGVYYFIKEAVLSRADNRGNEESWESKGKGIEIAAFLGGLFYLLNLSTLQVYNVPFEMFAAQFAALGWLFWLATRLYYSPSRKNIILFILVSLLASPMAYAATLFYAYFLVLAAYLYVLSLQKKKTLGHITHLGRMRHIGPISLILGLVLVVNSFWLLPNIYAVAFHAQEVSESKINSLFSDESFLYNREFGTPQNVAILKGFLFDWTQYSGNNQFSYLLEEWRSFTSQWPIVAIEYGLFGLVVVGVVRVIREKRVVGIAMLAVTGISLVFLMNTNPPLGWIFGFIRDHSSIFREALRTPFTKFSIILSFCYAVFFAQAQAWIIRHINRIRQIRPVFTALTPRTWGIMVVLLLTISMWPAFTGHFINQSMRLVVPKDYFTMYQWFDKQPADGRVAELPMPSFWGWTYYDWGYQGAGFLWFGIKQPVLDRDFDRWSGYNEQYFREISYAVYAQDVPLFESLLQKYQVRYLVFDDHVIAPGPNADKEILYTKEITNLLAASKQVHLASTFGKGLRVYEVDSQRNMGNQGYTEIKAEPTQVSPVMGLGFVDWAYRDQPNYFSAGTTSVDKSLSFFQYLFRSFLQFGDRVNANNIALRNNDYTLTLNAPTQQGKIAVPNYVTSESFLPVDVSIRRDGANFTVKLVYGIPWPENNTNRPITLISLPAVNVPQQAVLAVGASQPLTMPDNVTSEFQYIGRATLNTKADNRIAIYPQKPSSAITLQTNTTPLVPEQCGKVGPGAVFGINQFVSATALTLYGNNAISCVTVPLTQIQSHTTQTQAGMLLQVNFDYDTKNAAIPYYCLYDVITERCLYTSYGNPVQLITSPNHFSDATVLAPNLLPRLELRLFLDAINSHEQKEITYKDISLAFSGAVSETTLTPAAMNQTIQQATFLVKPTNRLTLFGYFSEPSNAIVTDITRVKREAETCNTVAPDFFNRQVINKGSERYVAYNAVNGTACDHFDYPTLTHDVGYLVIINARNVEGLPLRICISNNYSKRCDIYTALVSTSTFTNNFLFIPANTSPGFGYDINLNNVSIGSIRSVNDIKSIKVLAFPSNWLGQLHLESGGNMTNKANITDWTYTQNTVLPFWASASVKAPTNGKSLLIFNQGYERSWQLFKLYGFVPLPQFGNHVLANNWANGWLIGESGTYFIIFIPQFYEFLGFGLIIVILVLVLRKKRFLLDNSQDESHLEHH